MLVKTHEARERADEADRHRRKAEKMTAELEEAFRLYYRVVPDHELADAVWRYYQCLQALVRFRKKNPGLVTNELRREFLKEHPQFMEKDLRLPIPEDLFINGGPLIIPYMFGN